MFQRPTSLGEAFLIAAVKTKRVDHHLDAARGTGNWVARRTLLNAERPGFAVVTERDHSPAKPRKALPEKEYKAMVAGFEQVFLLAAVNRG